jgi:hypothetical protein
MPPPFAPTVSESYNHPDGVGVAPFFQIVKLIAAIFLAKVRRANVGRIPFSTRAT